MVLDTLNRDTRRNARSLTSLRLLLAGAVLSLATLASAAPIAPEMFNNLFADSLSRGDAASSAAPTIVLQGRTGAELFRDVEERLRRGEYQPLVERARTVLGKTPRAGVAFEVLGTAQFMLGNVTEAASALQSATEVESGQSGPWTKLGILQMESGETTRAETSLRKALTINADDRYAHQRLGMLMEYQGNVAEAIAQFTQGLKGTSSQYVGVAVNLARLHNSVRQYDQAIATLEPRLPLRANVALPQLILATAYLGAERFDEAAQRFERASALDADLAEAKLGVAVAKRGRGTADESLVLLDALIAARPDWTAAHWERAKTLLALNRPTDAVAAFQRYTTLGGNAADAGRALAQYHVDRKELNDAKTIYAGLISSGKADANVYGRLSELQLADNAAEQGERVLRDGLKRFPNDASLHLRLGSYLAALRRYDVAVTELAKADELAPNDPYVLQALTLAQARLGNAAAAAATAKRLHNIAPTPDIAILYATRLQAANQPAEAERVYRGLLEALPRHAVALNNLADLLAEGGKLGEAETLARRATEAAKDNGHLLDTLGYILYREAKYPEAADVMQRAAKLEPQAAGVRYHEGLALGAVGKAAESRAALTEALRLQADADWAADARNRLADAR